MNWKGQPALKGWVLGSLISCDMGQRVRFSDGSVRERGLDLSGSVRERVRSVKLHIHMETRCDQFPYISMLSRILWETGHVSPLKVVNVLAFELLHKTWLTWCFFPACFFIKSIYSCSSTNCTTQSRCPSTFGQLSLRVVYRVEYCILSRINQKLFIICSSMLYEFEMVEFTVRYRRSPNLNENDALEIRSLCHISDI